jgi:hypothetical protein
MEINVYHHPQQNFWPKYRLWHILELKVTLLVVFMGLLTHNINYLTLTMTFAENTYCEKNTQKTS